MIVLLAMPIHVVLSPCTGVCGCICPISYKVNRTIFASCAFRNNTLMYASVADAVTSLRIAHVIAMFLFSLIGVPSFGKVPEK